MRDGGTNMILQNRCPPNLAEHAAVAFDPVVGRMINNALDPATRKPLPC